MLMFATRRAIGSAQEGLATKQRPLDAYISDNKASQLQEMAAQLDGFIQRRDMAAVVSGL
jgi:hypothetical protein